MDCIADFQCLIIKKYATVYNLDHLSHTFQPNGAEIELDFPNPLSAPTTHTDTYSRALNKKTKGVKEGSAPDT